MRWLSRWMMRRCPSSQGRSPLAPRLVVLCALVSPDARLRLASFASAAFGVGLAVVARPHRAGAAQGFMAARGAVRRYARAPVRLCGHSRARLARSDDRRLHDLSRRRDDGRAAHRRGRLAAAARRRRPVHHARLFLGAGIDPRLPAGADRADVARDLYVRAARPLRRAGRFGARDPGARLRAPRGPCARRAAGDRSRARRRRRVRRLSCGDGGRRARHARRRRARAGGLRAQARRAPRPPARVARRPTRASSR